MPVPSAYLTKADSARPILEAIQRAGVPERFTHDFLQKQLGFTSSSDRPMIAVLKALRFLDESGVPLDRYRRYKDVSHAGAVLAEAMRDAYADIFAGDQNAHRLSSAQLRGAFARTSGKGEAVTKKMAATFKALADLADFTALPGEPAPRQDGDADGDGEPPASDEVPAGGRGVTLHHDVHIHLPVSTDIAVYDAIFRSMRENLGA